MKNVLYSNHYYTSKQSQWHQEIKDMIIMAVWCSDIYALWSRCVEICTCISPIVLLLLVSALALLIMWSGDTNL